MMCTRAAQGGIDHLQRLLLGGVTRDLFRMIGTCKLCSPTHSVREGCADTALPRQVIIRNARTEAYKYPLKLLQIPVIAFEH